jgi:DNA-directed RNA polymerase specialized sigma24 family protein
MAAADQSVCTNTPGVLFSPEVVSAVLRSWDHDIVRAAKAAACRFQGCAADVDDFAQVARTRLLRVTRRHGVKPAGYLRRVIARSIRKARLREASGLGAQSARTTPLVDDIPIAAPPVGDMGTDTAVRGWVHGLSNRLGQLYQLLYVRGLSQRDAALALDVSQPRVAQLHRTLLAKGRRDLADLI